MVIPKQVGVLGEPLIPDARKVGTETMESEDRCMSARTLDVIILASGVPRPGQ